MRERLNMPFRRQQLREEINPAQVIPDQGLRSPPDPASNAANQDTGQRHAQTHNPPAKACLTCGQWGHWKMDCPQRRPGARSLPPRLGGWNVHRDPLVPLGRSPLLPKTPAQPYESCSNDGTQVPAPQPMPRTRAQNLG